MELIKDGNGKPIAQLTEDGKNYRIADAKGNNLGNYNATADITYDRQGRKVGKGNQLMRLIRD